MWFTERNAFQSAAVSDSFGTSAACFGKWSLIFFFIAVLASQGLFAQSNAEEIAALRRYRLPSTAIAFQDLVEKESLYSLKGQPFSGIAFERYENGQLLRVMHIHDGRQHGPLYLWYPNGTPQMSANYHMGRLRGRFLGWYANGGIIYDMMISANGYGGSFVEDDSRRGDDETGDTEQEGNDND